MEAQSKAVSSSFRAWRKVELLCTCHASILKSCFSTGMTWYEMAVSKAPMAMFS
jgi:hypothetical protein